MTMTIMTPHSAGYNSMGSVPSPSFHMHHQQQQLQGQGSQYGGGEVPPHSAPPHYPKHDQMNSHMVVVSSSSSQHQQPQRVQNVAASQGNEHLGSPTGMQPRYSQQMARPSAPPPQERRELKQPIVGTSNLNNNTYSAYQQNQTPQSVSSQQQHLPGPQQNQQQNHYFQQQQQQSKDPAGPQQQHLGAGSQHQRHHHKSELAQQLGAPLPNPAVYPIQQSISAQNSSFQIQQQRPPPRHVQQQQQHNSNNSNNQQQQHVILPAKLIGSSTQQAQQHQPPLNSPINQQVHRQQESSISIAQTPYDSNNTNPPQHQHGPPIHLYNPAPQPIATHSRNIILANSGPSSATPHLSQTLSSENSAAGSPAVVLHDQLAYGPGPPAQQQHYQQPGGPPTTFVVQQGSGGQRIYIQQGAPGAHIVAQQAPPIPQPMPQGYNGSHRFYTNAVNSMAAAAAVGASRALDADNNPKEKYRELKRKFKFLVYENEYYQEELRNLQAVGFNRPWNSIGRWIQSSVNGHKPSGHQNHLHRDLLQNNFFSDLDTLQ